MIEFKAECGHTIRAKDEDEGKVVRCSYCGREAQVPVNEQDELDYLFSELDGSETDAKSAGAKRGRRTREPDLVPTGGPRSGGFNPFAVVLKMGYAAAIIIILILVGNYAFDYWKSFGQSQRSSQASEGEEAGDSNRERRREDRRGSSRRGLLTAKLSNKKGGVYVNSVPDGALIRVRPQGGGTVPEIFRDPEAGRNTANAAIELTPGRYEIAVAIRLNDKHLRQYPGYRSFRRRVDEGASNDVLEAFFLPDGADEVTTVLAPNRPTLLVRKYFSEVIGKDWTPLTALFLPDGPIDTVIKYLPRKTQYGFDDADVEWELDYYQVPKNDRRYVIDALHRVGMVMYLNPEDSAYHRFMIHLADGSFLGRRLEGRRPRPAGPAREPTSASSGNADAGSTR